MNIFSLLAANIVPIVCILAGAITACIIRDGTSAIPFLVLAFFFGVIPQTPEDDDDGNEEEYEKELPEIPHSRNPTFPIGKS